MKSNTWTIVQKEFARFFGDRQLIFTTLIMPGLLIYIVYSLMGNGISKIVSEGADNVVTLRVENMPASLTPMITGIDSLAVVVPQPFTQDDIDLLEDKDLNSVLLRFPADFDELVSTYTPQCGVPAPNVEIYYNSSNNAAYRIYSMLTASLNAYEEQLSNRFDINRADTPDTVFDTANQEDAIGVMIWSKLLPMLIVMMLFSGVMALTSSSIAGEKERGTIATLLVTPMRRSELALGKIVSLSTIALLSGISSFIGIALSLPKMISADGAESLGLGFTYTFNDYLALLLIIFSTVLIMSAAVSILSTLAKDVKNAATMVTPLMLVVMLAGLLPMFQDGASAALWAYAIPFYNSIESMTTVFAHEMQWLPIAVTMAANLALTSLAVWVLTRLFNNEKVMFGR